MPFFWGCWAPSPQIPSERSFEHVSDCILVAMRARAADAPHHDHIAEVLGINARVDFLAPATLEHVIVSARPVGEHTFARSHAAVLL